MCYNTLTDDQKQTLHKTYLQLLLEDESVAAPDWALLATNARGARDYGCAAESFYHLAKEQVASFELADALDSIEDARNAMGAWEKVAGNGERGPETTLAMVRIYRLSGDILCLLDRHTSSLPFLLATLEVAGEPIDHEEAGAMLVREKGVQELNMGLRITPRGDEGEDWGGGAGSIDQEKVFALDRLARIFIQTGRLTSATFCIYRSVNLAEHIRDAESMAKSYAT
jgi:hypothetical protein